MTGRMEVLSEGLVLCRAAQRCRRRFRSTLGSSPICTPFSKHRKTLCSVLQGQGMWRNKPITSNQEINQSIDIAGLMLRV